LITLATIKRRLNKFNPATPQDALRKCQFPLLFMDEGSYRVVYCIVGTQYVLKMPIQEWESWCWKGSKSKWIKAHVNHSRHEINASTFVMHLAKDPLVQALRPFMPEMPYKNYDTGVVLMRRYRRPTLNEWRVKSEPLLKVVDAVQKRNNDIKQCNCGIDSNGRLRMVDLGGIERLEDRYK
jgi:hypothetical protein